MKQKDLSNSKEAINDIILICNLNDHNTALKLIESQFSIIDISVVDEIDIIDIDTYNKGLVDGEYRMASMETGIYKAMNEYCQASLDPEAYQMWLKVLTHLSGTREMAKEFIIDSGYLEQEVSISWIAKEEMVPEYENERAKKILADIVSVLGTVNFSSHNQMKEAINGALSLADEELLRLMGMQLSPRGNILLDQSPQGYDSFNTGNGEKEHQ
jgi:hypothetical protein